VAKVTNPLGGTDARGRLGKRMVFRRGGIVTRYHVPRNPNTIAQLNAREAFKEMVMSYLTRDQADLLYAIITHDHDDRYPLISHLHDHGALSGLGDDDHSQYHNDTRGDARYFFVKTATQTAAYTAADNEHVLVDANGASANFAVTLPASPSVGVRVRITLITQHATRKITIARNGSNFLGGTDTSKYDLVLNGDSVTLEYLGGSVGWVVGAQQYTPHQVSGSKSSVTCTSGAWASHALDTSVFDNASMLDITTNHRINIRRAGRYLLTPFSYFSDALNDRVRFGTKVLVNTATDGGTQLLFTSTATTTNPTATAPFIYNFAAGDYCVVQSFQENGNNRNANGQLTVIEQR